MATTVIRGRSVHFARRLFSSKNVDVDPPPPPPPSLIDDKVSPRNLQRVMSGSVQHNLERREMLIKGNEEGTF